MKAFLVFNNINDLVFWKWDQYFVKHVLQLARGQNLIKNIDPNDDNEPFKSGELNPDIVIQIFSPIITSQRIMSCQFGNSYSSVQCRDNTNVVFDEYVGYLFVHISKNSICWMQKSLGVLITIVKYFCGPDVSLLKQEKQRTGVLLALNTWERLINRDQAALVGASECISAGTEAMTATLTALKAAISALPPPSTPTHAAIFVKNKLLSLYSTRGTDDLIPADTMFLGVMSAGAHDKWSHKPPSDVESRSPSPIEDEYEEQPYDGENIGQTLSWTVLIGGAPHGLHLHRLARNVTLVLAIGMSGNSAQNVAIALHSLSSITPSLTQRDLDGLKQAFAPLDAAMKKAIEGLKKCKSQPESPQRKLQSQWDVIRKRLIDLLGSRTEGSGSWVSLEAGVSSLAVGLRTAFHLACRGFQTPDLNIQPVAVQVHAKLVPLYQFLRVKAMGNFTLGSSPVMSRYVEEFPGLVHFLHIDRCYHRLTAPALPHCGEMLSRDKIWAMVERSRSNLHEGHLSSMWKDGALHYAHLVWFEDMSGGPLKPRSLSLQALRSLPPPNTLPDDYYLKLTEASFPGNSKNIRCLELFAVHIGLLPAGTALTHVRRLAATICDINAPHPSNLL